MKLRELIGDDWFNFLEVYIRSGFFETLQTKLLEEINNKERILCPSIEYVFEPFKRCPLQDLKVVILNDLPMKKVGINDGLPFSISFDNVGINDEAIAFWEGIEEDIYDGFILKQEYGYQALAAQGVLMLNCSITIAKKGEEWIEHYDMWRTFIKYIIHHLCRDKAGLIFIALGKKTREYISPVIKSQNYLLTASHPRKAKHFAQIWDSGGVFSTTNKILKQNQNTEIKWL